MKLFGYLLIISSYVFGASAMADSVIFRTVTGVSRSQSSLVIHGNNSAYKQPSTVVEKLTPELTRSCEKYALLAANEPDRWVFLFDSVGLKEEINHLAREIWATKSTICKITRR